MFKREVGRCEMGVLQRCEGQTSIACLPLFALLAQGVPSSPFFPRLKIPLQLYARLVIGTHSPEKMSSGPLAIKEEATMGK